MLFYTLLFVKEIKADHNYDVTIFSTPPFLLDFILVQPLLKNYSLFLQNNYSKNLKLVLIILVSLRETVKAENQH